VIKLNVATYNIHKGFSHFNRRMVMHELRDRLRELNADIVFLQEVQGENIRNVQRHQHYPVMPHHEFLADQMWPHHAYGKNSVYANGHHGNAILSRFEIARWENLDISAHRFENRGLLHCELDLSHVGAHKNRPLLHCFCVHLGLLKNGRRQQFGALIARIKKMVPLDAPLIIAGDFNDWNNHAGRLFAHELQLHEAFEITQGKPARSYPVAMPMLRLDRIYVRGLSVQSAQVHAHHPWNKISDHAALSTTLSLI